MHGLSSGGGNLGSMNAAMKLQNGDGGGGGYNPSSNNNPYDDMNLSDYLPGGKNYAGDRKLAGGNATNFQIQSKEVNIFNRISERIRARCSQGLLRDCIP